ncbi:MAG: hypothetical protein ACXWIM_19995 [Burkholderiales bacterium]
MNGPGCDVASIIGRNVRDVGVPAVLSGSAPRDILCEELTMAQNGNEDVGAIRI